MGKLNRKQLALIHIGAKAAGVGKDADPELYKETLLAHGGAESASDLTYFGYLAVMRHFEKCGFKPQTRKRKHKGRPKNMDGLKSRQQQLQKIQALLTVGKRPWSYADALAKRLCKVERIAWVKTEELYKIISVLTLQAKREGWDLSGAKH